MTDCFRFCSDRHKTMTHTCIIEIRNRLGILRGHVFHLKAKLQSKISPEMGQVNYFWNNYVTRLTILFRMKSASVIECQKLRLIIKMFFSLYAADNKHNNIKDHKKQSMYVVRLTLLDVTLKCIFHMPSRAYIRRSV